MRIIISAFTWEQFLLSGMCQLELVPLADKYGCAGIEFRPYWRSAIDELPEIKEFLADYGLVSTYACNQGILGISEEEVRSSLAAIGRSLLLAERLGAEILSVKVASGQFNRDFISVDWWQQALGEIADCAQDKGIVLGIENGQNAADGDPVLIRDVITQIGSQWLKATYNTGNWLAAGWDPAEAMDILEGKIGYVHLKDMNSAHSPVYPGAGQVGILGLVDRLNRQGYQGPHALEFPGGQSPAASVKASLQYLRHNQP